MEAYPTTLVMMATYNGERYLCEQIDSILAQEGVDVHLRVCDDRSTDGTFAILQDYASRYPNVTVSQNETNVGVGKNFMQMVYEEEAGDYEYLAFSDQDDIWLPNKLSHAISMLAPHANPTLYYSDVADFDDHHEWSELASFREVLNHLDTLMLRNWACGCTMVFNQSLRNLLCRYEPTSYPRIHDAWTHVVAQCCAEVIADFDHALIRRRIAGQNTVGELSDHHRSIDHAISDAANLAHEATHAPTMVACQLVEGYADLLKPEALPAIDALLTYHDSFGTRIRTATSFDVWQPTLRGRLITRACFVLDRY